MSCGYAVTTGAFAATTGAKTAINIKAGSGAPLRIVEWDISADGVTSSAVPAVVEVCSSTNATAGTPGSSPTPAQIRGLTRGSSATAGVNYTGEPTVLTAVKSWYVPQFNGMYSKMMALGREHDVAGSAAWCLRVNVSASVNIRANVEFEEG